MMDKLDGALIVLMVLCLWALAWSNGRQASRNSVRLDVIEQRMEEHQ